MGGHHARELRRPTVGLGRDDEPVAVSFTTGGGDGVYPTWVGRTASGDTACFLTDFFVLGEDDLTGSEPSAAPRSPGPPPRSPGPAPW
ncbi:DUF4241 domain-containing protein [Streptomyces sp. M19]